MSRNQYPPASNDEQDIIDKCHKLGVKAPRLSSFIDERDKYPITEDIAKLFAIELSKDHDWSLLSIMMQASAVPKYRDLILDPIVKILRTKSKGLLKDLAINDLEKLLLPKDGLLLADLLQDKNIGENRILLIPIYSRLAKEAAIPILRKIVGDIDTRTYALHQLSILGDTSIENELRELSNHVDAWRRKIARDGLKRLGKKTQIAQ
jgi:hypothetical protein